MISQKSHNYWDTRFDHGGNSLNIGQENFLFIYFILIGY